MSAFPPVVVSPAKVPRLGVSVAFSLEQMDELGEAILRTQLERTARAVDRFDRPQPPLKEKYKLRKQRKGGKPIRDMRRSGATMRSLASERTVAGEVRVAFHGADEQRAAWFRQLADQFFGLSPQDAETVDRKVLEIHRRNLQRRLFD